MNDKYNIMNDANARLMDCESMPDDIHELNQWAEVNGYSIIRTAKEEYRFTREDSGFDIVLRYMDDHHLIALVEPYQFNTFENTYFDSYVSIANPSLVSVWKGYRMGNVNAASICTNMMPMIVTRNLLSKYGWDGDRLFQIAERLAYFGTNKFDGIHKCTAGVRTCYGGITTDHFICYAPGELEIITNVCAEFFDGMSEKEIKNVNLKDLRKNLRFAAKNVPPTMDIVFFGRHLYGCGLQEYSGTISYSEMTIGWTK